MCCKGLQQVNFKVCTPLSAHLLPLLTLLQYCICTKECNSTNANLQISFCFRQVFFRCGHFALVQCISCRTAPATLQLWLFRQSLL